MAGAPHRFDRDTALTLRERREDGGVPASVFEARIDEGWWIVAGPNGGYLAAILLRAMTETVADPVRHPRSQTTHFTARAVPGQARVVTRVERQGRSLSTVTARLEQEGRLIAFSIGALGTPRAGERPTFQDARMPEAPAPDETPERPRESSVAFPFRERWDMRPAFDFPAPDPEREAVTGGWIRLASGRAADGPLLAALSDAWPPAVFQKLGRWEGGQGVPTVELTTHFRAPEHAARLAPASWYLVRFQTRCARAGFLEEDGEIWSQDGTLLAQSRQLALLA
jgi:acyl-CoA thioesterase